MKVLGGRLAETYGTKLVFGISNFLVAVLALITPVLAKVDVWYVLAIRLLQVLQPLQPLQLLSPHYSGLDGGLRLPLPEHDGQ